MASAPDQRAALIDQASLRLDLLLRRLEAGAPVSFAAPGEEPSPEQTLQAELSALGEGRREPEPDFLHQLLRQLDRRVETRDAAGRILATSDIGFAGDTRTHLEADTDADVLRRHARRFERELAALHQRRLTIAAALHMAAKLAAAAGSGNPLLALPAAWRFISQVAAQAKAD